MLSWIGTRFFNTRRSILKRKLQKSAFKGTSCCIARNRFHVMFKENVVTCGGAGEAGIIINTVNTIIKARA